MTRYHTTSKRNIPFTAEEEAEWDAMEAEWAAGADDRAAAEIRKERDVKLTSCDWTQVIDAPVDQEAWAVYRQALRDIPDQEGFPNEVAWPTDPVAEEPVQEEPAAEVVAEVVAEEPVEEVAPE
jgi:hypothetical protein